MVGPDLTTIGTSRTHEDLLESLLTPSKRIEPQYAGYIVLCFDGKVHTGVLVERDEQQITLRDPQGVLNKIANEEVDSLRPLSTSIMPESQLANCTSQEVADLLAYLASLRGLQIP